MVAVALRHTFLQPSDQSWGAVIWGQEVGGRGSPTTFCVVRFSMNEGVAVARAHRKWTNARDELSLFFSPNTFVLPGCSVGKFRVEENVSSCSEETRLAEKGWAYSACGRTSGKHLLKPPYWTYSNLLQKITPMLPTECHIFMSWRQIISCL